MKVFLLIGLMFSCLCGCTQPGSIKESKKALSADSIFTLGMEYLNEDSDQPKYDSAQYYLEKSAQLNYRKSFHVLGYEYLLGNRLERNKEKGLLYLKKATELGETEAFLTLAEFYYYQKDIQSVKEMLEKGNSLGDKYATYQLYNLYNSGYAFGQPDKKDTALINLQKSFDYLLKAAEMGSFDAQLSLIYLYTKGEKSLVSPDREKALFYFKQAEKNPEAQETPGATDELEIAKKELDL